MPGRLRHIMRSGWCFEAMAGALGRRTRARGRSLRPTASRPHLCGEDTLDLAHNSPPAGHSGLAGSHHFSQNSTAAERPPRKSVNCIRLFRLRDIFSSSTPRRVPRVALSRVPAPPFTRWPGRVFSAAWPPSRRASRATARAPRPSPRRRARSRIVAPPRSPASLRRSARVGGTPAAALTSRRLSRRLFAQQDRLKKIKAAHGDKSLGEVTVNMAMGDAASPGCCGRRLYWTLRRASGSAPHHPGAPR